MKFAEPWLLFGIVAAPILLPVSWWLLDRSRRTALARFATSGTLARIAPPRAPGALWLRRGLILAAALLLSLAAARPQWGTSAENIRRKGLDVAFVLDTSLSMAAPAEGGPGSRLEAARRAMADLLDMLRGDRAALVVFAGEAQLLCPLTIDQGALRLLLDSADPDLLPTAGTDIGAGIAKALTAFRSKERKFKAIVLLTDGEDNEGTGVETARRASEQGVVIHAVGFGSPAGEPIPLRDNAGRISGYKKDSEGHVVSTRLDDATLKAVTDAGNGVYAAGSSGERGLKAIADSIAAMEKREYDSTRASQAEERFEWPLLGAFLCLALEALLAIAGRGERAAVLERRVVGAEVAGDGARKKTRGRAAVVALVALVGLEAGVRDARAASPAQEGQRAFSEKRYEDAIRAFREALERDPDSPALHYNLGTALLAAGQDEEALQELERAAATGDPALRSRAHYNAGNGYYKAGKRKEALEAYRQALRQAPPDLDAKHNFELVQRELAQSPTPSPSPEPTPSPQPSPSPSPSPSPQATPSPSPGESPSPTPGTSPTPEPSPGGEGSPTPSPASSPSPTPGEGLDREQAERLLDALEAQEAQERKDKQKSKAELKQRRPAKDW